MREEKIDTLVRPYSFIVHEQEKISTLKMYDAPAQGRLSIELYLQQLCFTDKNCLLAKMDDEG